MALIALYARIVVVLLLPVSLCPHTLGRPPTSLSTTRQAADKAVKRKQRPPVHEYIRHLIYDRLAGGQVTKVRRLGCCCC